MAKGSSTKAELIRMISKKLKRLKPYQRRSFLQGLKYKTKAELEYIATHMKVKIDKDGYEVTYY